MKKTYRRSTGSHLVFILAMLGCSEQAELDPLSKGKSRTAVSKASVAPNAAPTSETPPHATLKNTAPGVGATGNAVQGAPTSPVNVALPTTPGNAVQGAPASPVTVGIPTALADPDFPLPPSEEQRKAQQKKAEDAIKSFCGRCHEFPEPKDFTMETWGPSIEYMYQYFQKYNVDVANAPPPQAVLGYYAHYAARSFSTPAYDPIEAYDVTAHAENSWTERSTAIIADLVHVSAEDGFGGTVLVSDMLSGRILALSPDNTKEPTVLGKVNHPARLTVVDLDADGLKDVIVAELGTFGAGDHERGRVVWLRQSADGRFEERTLLSEVGRVSEIAAGDLDGEGTPDLVIAEFGWLNTGSLSYIANAGQNWQKDSAPKVTKIDRGRGAVSAQISDLDGDKKNEIIALFGQEREEVIVYQSRPGGRFKARNVFRANTSLWGATQVQIGDINGDSKPDIIVANGDTLDAPRVAEFQGVHGLVNEGKLKFAPRQLAVLPGVQDVALFDYDADGDLDMLAVSSVTPTVHKMMKRARPAKKAIPSALLLINDGQGRYDPTNLSAAPPCFSAVTVDNSGQIHVGQFGIGWDLLGQRETIGDNQALLSECGGRNPVESWRLGPHVDAKEDSPFTSPRLELQMKRQGMLKDRVQAYKRLLETEPLKADYFMGLGVAHAQLGDKDEALKVMRRAVQLNPKAPDLMVNVATLLNTMDQPKEALKLAREAIALRPVFPEALNAQGVAQARLGNAVRAIELFQQAIAQNPTIMPFQYNLLQLYMMNMQGDKAKALINQILTRDPSDQFALKMMEQIRYFERAQ